MKNNNRIQSMTGFGSSDAKLSHFGIVSIELRSINHKGLEIAIHVPDGFLAMENKIKKEIENRINRGRITCSMTVIGDEAKKVIINKPMIRAYLESLDAIKREFKIGETLRLDTLIHLPGVLSLVENKGYVKHLWPRIKPIVKAALDELILSRQNEGAALYTSLRQRGSFLESSLSFIRARFKKATQERLSQIKSDEERAAFLRDSDITEEIERLGFHAASFKAALAKSGPMGKELDFMAQEMQREANTMAAKSFDITISSRVIQIKSQIEKIREQLQNIE